MVALLSRGPESQTSPSINWGHPLSHGLARYVTWRGASGSRVPLDLVRGDPWTLTALGLSDYFVGSRFGGSFDTGAVHAPSQSLVPPGSGPVVEDCMSWTIAVMMWGLDPTHHTLRVYTNQTGTPLLYLDLDNGSSVARLWYRDDGGSLVQVNGTTNTFDSRPHSLIATRAGGNFALYLDGRVEATSSGYAGGSSFTSSAATLLGGAGTVALAYAGFWRNRALSPGEAAWLAAEPYALMQTPVRRFAKRGSSVTFRPQVMVIG